jgi:hypothetical protein
MQTKRHVHDIRPKTFLAARHDADVRRHKSATSLGILCYKVSSITRYYRYLSVNHTTKCFERHMLLQIGAITILSHSVLKHTASSLHAVNKPQTKLYSVFPFLRYIHYIFGKVENQ